MILNIEITLRKKNRKEVLYNTLFFADLLLDIKKDLDSIFLQQKTKELNEGENSNKYYLETKLYTFKPGSKNIHPFDGLLNEVYSKTTDAENNQYISKIIDHISKRIHQTL